MSSCKVYNYNVKKRSGEETNEGKVSFSVGDESPRVLEVSRYDDGQIATGG